MGYFFKWANLGLFRSFQTNNTIFTTNQCEKMSCPSWIRRQDSNPRPLEHESPTITTRPGLPPYKWAILAQDKFLIIGPIVFLLVFVLFHITIQIEIA